MKMFCQNCGKELSENTEVCPSCGTRIYASQPEGSVNLNKEAPPVNQGYGTTGYNQPNAPYSPNPYGQNPYGQNQYGQNPYDPTNPYGPNGYPNQGKVGTAPMVLGIIGVIFAILLPIVTYPCSIVGLIQANKEIAMGMTTKKTGRILNIVALVIAGLNSIAGVILALS